MPYELIDIGVGIVGVLVVVVIAYVSGAHQKEKDKTDTIKTDENRLTQLDDCCKELKEDVKEMRGDIKEIHKNLHYMTGILEILKGEIKKS